MLETEEEPVTVTIERELDDGMVVGEGVELIELDVDDSEVVVESEDDDTGAKGTPAESFDDDELEEDELGDDDDEEELDEVDVADDVGLAGVAVPT